MTDRPWVNGQEAADLVGVSWPTLRQFVLDHDIPHLRVGRLWRFQTSRLMSELERLAELQVAL